MKTKLLLLWLQIIFLYVIVPILGILAWYGTSYFEVRAFNSCTHSNATTWDAMFTQLRAIECKK